MSATNANRVGHLWASQNTPFGSQGIELWEPNIYIWVLSFQSVYNSSNLQRLLQVSKFLLMYSFTHTKIVFLFRHLPPEIVIFINVCYQMKCFSDDSFPFLGAGFANIPPTFLISKTLKYSEQYIRDHLSDTKAKSWICSACHAVF